jgi:hypothetical protein
VGARLGLENLFLLRGIVRYSSHYSEDHGGVGSALHRIREASISYLCQAILGS